MKLFTVHLGGRAEGCNTELHDTVFVVGSSIEETHQKLTDKWFGINERLHIDCYAELKYVDGYEVTLEKSCPGGERTKKLYFVNYGAYQPGTFSELHEIAFYVADSRDGAVARARKELCQGLYQAHLDDNLELRGALDMPQADVDDVIELTSVDQYHIVLTPTEWASKFQVRCGYIRLQPPSSRQYRKRGVIVS
ncbi:MAG: DUF1543 domain-containing protein [Waddliaceae bacterium]